MSVIQDSSYLFITGPDVVKVSNRVCWTNETPSSLPFHATIKSILTAIVRQIIFSQIIGAVVSKICSYAWGLESLCIHL